MKKIFLIFFSNCLLAHNICIQWQQTNFEGSCANLGIRSEGEAFIHVNLAPVPFYTVSQRDFNGCFDRSHLLIGNNYFSLEVTVNNGKSDHCTNMHHLFQIKLPNGEQIILFSVRHQGQAVHGATTINLSLSRIAPELAAELNRYTGLLRQQIEQIEAFEKSFNSEKLPQKDLDAIEQQIRRHQQSDIDFSEAAEQAIEEINLVRQKLPNKQILLDGDQILRRIYVQLKTLHSGHVDAITLPELAKLLHENRASFRATDLWNLSELINDIARNVQQPPLKARIRQFSNELEQKIAQMKAPMHGGVEAFQELAQKSLATIKSTVVGAEVQDRRTFLSAYRLWLNKQILAAETLLNNPNIPRSDLVALEQTNHEIKSFVAQYYDEKTGWLLKCHISGDIKQAIEQLIQIDKLRGKKTQEALNFWLKQENLNPQQKLIAETLQTVVSGLQVVRSETGQEYEELVAFNALLEQCIEAVKQTSYTLVDAGTAMIPFVGDFKDLCEAVTGKRLCLPTTESLSQEDRVYAAVGMIAGTGSFWKAMSQSGRSLLSSISELVLSKRFLFSKKHWNKIIEHYSVPKMVAETLRKQKWGLPEAVFQKIKPLIDAGIVQQAELAAKTKRGKAGIRWLNEHQHSPGSKFSIRIDKADPKAAYASQRVDHVVIRSNGKIIGSKGQIITPSMYSEPAGRAEAHVSLVDWIKWRQFDSP